MYTNSGARVEASRYGSEHSGVHVVVVHETQGHLMTARHFATHKPAESARLAQCLTAVHLGRVLVIVGAVSKY